MIYVMDSIMGSGKTTWAIANMKGRGSQHYHRFIYAAPFLKEDKRIKNACPQLAFIEPNGLFSKQADFKRLIAEGKNIVTTHAMIRNLNLSKQDCENLQLWHYALFLDEVIEVITPIEQLNEDDYVHLFDGMIEVDAITDRVIAFFCALKQHIQILLHLGVAMFVFKYNLICACVFEFSNLAIDILLVLICATSGITVDHDKILLCQFKVRPDFVYKNTAETTCLSMISAA